jgi:hypothetical protein
MKRFYMTCDRCRKRMIRVYNDEDGDRSHYLCKCGERGTYHHSVNGWSGNWSKAMFERAVRDGILTRSGTPRI